MTDHLEIEASFAMADGELEPVLRALLPFGWTIDLDGMIHEVAIRHIACTLHLYSQRTGAARRERLKLRWCGTQLEVVHEHKRMVGDDKLETVLDRPRSEAAKLAAINGYGACTAAFAKRRLSIELTHPGRPRIKVALDRLVAFDPADPERRGPTVHHLEIEARDRAAVAALVGSRWFARDLAPHVRPLVAADTKWLLAAPWCRPDSVLAFASFPVLRSYVARVIELAFPPANPLAPIA